MNYRLTIFITFILTGLSACVEPYSVDFGAAQEYIVVDGVVTDMEGPQFITLSKTNPEAKNESSEFTQTIWTKGLSTLPLTKAKVKVIVNESQSYDLTEYEPGVYQLPLSFRGKVGESYQLQFQTEEGKSYESSGEKMLPVSPVKRAYDVFNPKGISKLSNTMAIIRPATTFTWILTTRPLNEISTAGNGHYGKCKRLARRAIRANIIFLTPRMESTAIVLKTSL
jgi:hypothetical protein